ncbi:hypothetical protein GBAR_LOCUS1358 [Geodia barretti]|uniref:Uncharacterized protein n=1 Tax=Geodia barretti TaxID=519541 RepID=A0AA35QVX1_GEOBA|nr:hypothetical protein GBAR_LOCUS1358 [Geodia barretti]
MDDRTIKPRMSKAQARQHQRILTDEKIQAQQQVIRNDVRATLRANWNESLEEASERKILVKKTEEIEREVALANNALVMVCEKGPAEAATGGRMAGI